MANSEEAYQAWLDAKADLGWDEGERISEFYFGPRKDKSVNKQVNPDHCYETEDGVMYTLESAFKVDGVRDSPEWHVLKDGRKHRTFTSLMAAKGFLEHVLTHPESDKPRVIVAGGGSAEFKAKLAAALNGGVK